MRTSEDPPAAPRPAVRRICLFGGSFDPVHDGHLALARAAHAGCQLERVIFLPAHQSPHKPTLQPAPAAHRLAMLQLAVGDLPWAEVSEWELAQRGPGYSWQAVEHFSSALGVGVDLCWLLGADQWAALETWARPEVLAARLLFIVCPREGTPVASRPGFRHEVVRVHHPASSTLVREAVRQVTSLAGLADPKVADYIARHGLYRAGKGG